MKILTAFLIALSVLLSPLTRSRIVDQESWERDRVVLIHGEAGTCTGVKVRAPSGKRYILTASHCAGLASNGTIGAKMEDGTDYQVKVIMEDLKSDLLLLEAADTQYVDIAAEIELHQKVHTMTHGHGYSSYRTDGEILDTDYIKIPYFQISDEQDLQRCKSAPKFEVAMSFFMGMVCAIVGVQQESTAWITPGSSGGPLFNAKSELLGIASATSAAGFSSWVTLSDIKVFLADK